MHLVFIMAGFCWVKEDDMPSTLMPTCVPGGLCVAMGCFSGGLSVEDHRRGRPAEAGQRHSR